MMGVQCAATDYAVAHSDLFTLGSVYIWQEIQALFLLLIEATATISVSDVVNRPQSIASTT